MRIRRKRRKGVRRKSVVGKNCRFLSYEDGLPRCGLRAGERCSKTRECGYEEESRTVNRLQRSFIVPMPRKGNPLQRLP